MFVFVLLQFRVPCGRASPPGAGQTGEDWFPFAVHDRRGPDAGLVPPPEGGVMDGRLKMPSFENAVSLIYSQPAVTLAIRLR